MQNGEIKLKEFKNCDEIATLNKQLDELLASECILCGSIMIDNLDLPFDSKNEPSWILISNI